MLNKRHYVPFKINAIEKLLIGYGEKLDWLCIHLLGYLSNCWASS